MVWVYIIAAVVIFLLLKELIRLPTVGKYGERYVFITGCDTGFGNLLAKRLDSMGFNVFAGCYTEKGEDELRKVSSARLNTFPLDVTKPESIRKARETVAKQLPPNKGLWAIVNNAGIGTNAAPTEWLTRADYDACLAVNLFGVIEVTKAFQPLVRKEKGRIVNMASIAGRLAFAIAPYGISKHGVEAFSDCLRREVLKQGITVHIIEPSWFKTEIVNYEKWFMQMDSSYNASSEDVQLYYGKGYAEEVKALFTSLSDRSMCTKLDLVVDAYTHAITAMFPRPRYIVGPDRYFWKLLWNLPEWISDRLLCKNLPTPEGLWATVNNAGISGSWGSSEWFTRADYQSCLAVKLYGVIDITRIFQPLVRRGRGRIVNMSSIVGRIAVGSTPYTVSKYGVEAFSDCLRREVLRQGITVHLIEPGIFKTDMVNNGDDFVRSFQHTYNQTSPDVQLYYGTDYVQKRITSITTMVQKAASTKTYLVVDAYTHAITAMFPRYRYLVGSDAKYLIR